MNQSEKNQAQHVVEWLSAVMVFAFLLPLPLWGFRVLNEVLNRLMTGGVGDLWVNL